MDATFAHLALHSLANVSIEAGLNRSWALGCATVEGLVLGSGVRAGLPKSSAMKDTLQDSFCSLILSPWCQNWNTWAWTHMVRGVRKASPPKDNAIKHYSDWIQDY